MLLRPTLWRTCRAVANRDRLRMIALLGREPGLTVSVIAARLHVSMSRASLYLRVLEARSLLQVRRNARWVHYQPAREGNLLPLVIALTSTLRQGRNSLNVAFALATAFTHPRRIEIYKTLRDKPQNSPGSQEALAFP